MTFLTTDEGGGVDVQAGHAVNRNLTTVNIVLISDHVRAASHGKLLSRELLEDDSAVSCHGGNGNGAVEGFAVDGGGAVDLLLLLPDPVVDGLELQHHAPELRLVGGDLVRELERSATVALRDGEPVEVAVRVLDHVGVLAGRAVATAARLDVVLGKDGVVGIHGGEHSEEPFEVGRLAGDFLSGLLEGGVVDGVARGCIVAHSIVNHGGEVGSRGRVDAVAEADIDALGQPVVAVADAALHELGRHDGLLELRAVELVAAEALVEGLPVVDDDCDLLGADHHN